MQLSDVTVYEGEDAEFIFEINQNDLEVSWFVNDTEATGERYEVSSDGLAHKLVIKDTKLLDDGTKVDVIIRETKTSVHLWVKVSNYSSQISDVMVKEGDHAVFSCEVRDVTDTVQWFVNGNTISNNRRYTEIKEGIKRELRIHHTSLSDDDTKVCVAISDEERVGRLYVGDLDGNKRRWQTIGNAMNSILCPTLRQYIRLELETLWNKLETTHTISTQCLPTILKSYGKMYLRYKAINGNERHGKMCINGSYNRNYDYTVKTSLDLANLFLSDSSPVITGFDNTCDLSAALNIISGCILPPGHEADKVRIEVRNVWGHCNLKDWDASKFDDSFCLMSDLVRKLSLPSSSEQTSVLAELKKFKDTEMENTIYGHIPQHIREQFKKIVNVWKTDDEIFVPTNAAEDVMAKIEEHNFVVVTGNSGTGKSFTVRHTAMALEKMGFIIVPAAGPEDIRTYFKHGCKTVFVFDDLCGRFTLKHNYLEQWKLNKQSLETILKDECCKVLASCRLQVFSDKKMADFISEIGGNEFKISLSVEEGRAMIRKYFENKVLEIEDEELSMLDFLPFLCSNFRNRDISELERCFENPFDFFSNEFEKLFLEDDDGKRKYCAITLCVLYNNTLTWDELNKEPEVFQLLVKECELSSAETAKRIKTSLESLIGVYITYDNGTYKIIHDKLFDFTARHFGKKMLDLFIKFADSDFLRERFFIGSWKTSNTADCIEVTRDKIKLFMERLVSDWKTGNVVNVFCNTNMKSEQFRQSFLSYLKHLDVSSQRELVQKRDNNNGDTPLFQICFKGDLEFTKWILSLGADVNLGRNANSTPLHIACLEENIEVVRLLLECKQINVNLSDDSGMTALHGVCITGNDDIVKLFLQCEQINVNHSDVIGFTALHWACQNGNIEVVRLLLQCEQIDVNNRDVSGHTALHFACMKGNIEVVRLLLQCEQIDVNHSNVIGHTALYLACKKGNIEVVRLLLECKQINVNYSDVKCRTALHWACLKGYIEVVRLLLQCKQIDVNCSDLSGTTPLHLACLKGYIEVVRLLLQCKQIDVNYSDVRGRTGFHLACYSGYNDIVKLLLQCKQIDVNCSDLRGVTALNWACEKGNIEVLRLLVKCKRFDVNHSSTALKRACLRGNIEMVRLLLQCKRIDVRPALDWALRVKNIVLVKLLREY